MTPDSCWPIDLVCGSPTRPKAVLLAEVRDIADNNGNGSGPTFTSFHIEWDYVPVRGKPHIRVKNIPGLTGGRKYRIRLLVVYA